MKWLAALLLIMCSTLPGCIHSDVVVSSYAIHRQVPVLRSGGTAELEGFELSRSTEVEARVRGRVIPRVRMVTVGELIDRCPEDAPVGPARDRARASCLLLRTDAVTLGRRVHPGKTAGLWAGAAVVVVALGALIGVVASADARDSHPGDL